MLDQRGVAALTVVIIVAASAGAAVATPVAVDAADVDPDHPLYGLERLGERIRMVNNEHQMRERFQEYSKMCEKGKGSQYQAIMQEFREKMRNILENTPENTEAKARAIAWMQEQMPGIGRIRLELMREAAVQLREDLEGAEAQTLENCLAELEECKSELNASPEKLDEIEAHLALIRERIENIADRHGNRVRDRVFARLNVEANVEENIEITIRGENFVWRKIALENIYQEQLERFDNLYAEVQAMLAGAPENTHGKHAAERLTEKAVELKDRAIEAYESEKIGRVLGLVHASNRLLSNAKMILEHASEWEPESGEEWVRWGQEWAGVKRTFIDEGVWENILRNYEQYAEKIRQRWEERLHRGP